MDFSLRQRDALRLKLKSEYPLPVHVELGMRYGRPSIASAMRKLHAAQVDKLLVLPLYPQYSGSTTGSTFDALAAELGRWRWVPELRFVNSYHDTTLYIEALAQSVSEYWQAKGRSEMLLMSFHGVPKRYLNAGDPYHCQCLKTGRLLAERLQLEEGDWRVVFQSRFGREEWLRPYCDETLRALPEEGVKSVDVICPGFSVDCLETLEEIDGQNREIFLQSGGDSFQYIPCLNDHSSHIDLMATIVGHATLNWHGSSSTIDTRAERKNRALALGAGR